MPQHDPTPKRRISQREARTIRRWTLVCLGAGAILTALASRTDGDTDRMIAIIAAASFATGAIVVRRPAGFRLILAGSSLAMLLVAIGIIQG